MRGDTVLKGAPQQDGGEAGGRAVKWEWGWMDGSWATDPRGLLYQTPQSCREVVLLQNHTAVVETFLLLPLNLPREAVRQLVGGKGHCCRSSPQLTGGQEENGLNEKQRWLL